MNLSTPLNKLPLHALSSGYSPAVSGNTRRSRILSRVTSLVARNLSVLVQSEEQMGVRMLWLRWFSCISLASSKPCVTIRSHSPLILFLALWMKSCDCRLSLMGRILVMLPTNSDVRLIE